jgi:Rieske Fe-S protein
MEDPVTKSCSGCVGRRLVLRGGAAAVLLAALPGGCMQGTAAPAGPVQAGNVADTTVGALQVVAGETVILARDNDGLYAMSRVCTHQGQLLTIVSAGGEEPTLHCYGHGSDFNRTGAVTRGPANIPLEHFKVDLDPADGSIIIQSGMPVPASTRTPV